MPRYAEYRAFPDVHSNTITHVAFNSDAKLLASASLDGNLFIWNVRSSSLSYHYFTGNSILSLIWADAERVLCGLKDGSITCLVINCEKKTLDVTGTWGHSYPVEVLALSKNRLASGAHQELFIWRWNYNAVMSYQEREVTLTNPPELVPEKNVVVTALHWSANNDGGSASLLIVGYMHHGIRIFETQCWGEVRCIVVDELVGAAAVSPDHKFIAISDVFTGFRVYRLDTGVSLMHFEQEVTEARPVPVTWLHGGHAILGGSTVSDLNIWYVDASHSVVRLPVAGSTGTTAIAAHFNSDSHAFLVACGSETEEHKHTVIIWRAKKRKGPRPSVSSDDEEVDIDEDDEDDEDDDNGAEEDLNPEQVGLCGRFSLLSVFKIAIALLGVVLLALQLAGNNVASLRGL
uniref:G-protein comlpex beta subunit CpcB n=1 Tax=Ganoderma boninense TaxID=34458 RepID=A0A5K1JSL7_9APHY|nr:G-protein comlpex beta subunit CpcB [Ganoderma boninense]